ncbi:hypothetical protein QQZ08_007606 [Neonectria magnoliae]|uniref:Uncharacterized protein n=1 Tax=Neonectria magnoliae TaxID=2732573 RepID=A0ABR1HXE9_9HYPO
MSNSPPSRTDSASAGSQGSATSRVPLRRYLDDDEPGRDAPPEYSVSDPNQSFPAVGDSDAYPTMLPTHGPGYPLQPFSADAGTAYYLDARLDNDPAFLEQHIHSLAVQPPRPFVRVRGVHCETKKAGDKRAGDKKNRDEVVDFDVQVELTPLLYEDMALRRGWQRLEAVRNFDKVRRGTVFPTRAPGYGGSGPPEEGTPRVDQWCRRYCGSPARLKVFTLERRLTGWDFALVGGRLDSLVRSTNYRGRVAVTFPTLDSRVHIYSDCRANRWRLTRWVELLFYFSFLWILSWPWLAFATKWFDTVYVEWPMGQPDDAGNMRYACLSEEQWYELWRRPVLRAVLGRKQGTLQQADLDDAYDAPGAEDFIRGVHAGLEVIQRTTGWGGDTETA